MRTLQQILTDANSYLDLEAALPTGAELTVRTNYANQAVWDATAAGRIKEFDSIYEVGTSTLASISLPSGFREFTGIPKVYTSENTYFDYPEIDPHERFDKDPSDKYCYVLGNPSSGYTAIFKNLVADATLSLDFQRYPSGFATLTDKCELSDPTYVTSKVESYVLQSRSDERFPIVESEAQNKLKNMLSLQMRRPTGGENRVRRTGTSTYSIGS